jgi:hypothetical protein
MLPLDHFESDAEVVEDGHGEIVKEEGSSQFSVLGSQFSVPSFLARLAGVGCGPGLQER